MSAYFTFANTFVTKMETLHSVEEHGENNLVIYKTKQQKKKNKTILDEQWQARCWMVNKVL